MNKLLTKSKAFTLIEVLVVIVLLGALTASQVPRVASQFDKPKDLSVIRDLQKYIDAAKLAHAQGKDITNIKHLNQELVPELRIDSNEMSKTNNPYGNPYTHKTLPPPDKGFEIISTGGKEERTIKVKIGDDNKLDVTWKPEVNGTGLGTGGNNTTPQTPVEDFYSYTPENINGVEGYKVGLTDEFKTYLDSNDTSTNYYGFTNGQPLPNPGSTYNGKPVTNMYIMFLDSQATTLDLSSFDTSNVINMYGMFAASKATTLNLSSFNTSNVTDMQGMFSNSQATILVLSSFDTSNVTNMYSMFMGSKTTTLNLSSFDTSNVTNMSYMFESSKATTLDLSSFDTSKVTDMSGMFQGSQATTLDLSRFDTSKVTGMSYMFYGSQATTLDLSSFDTSKVTNMDSIFSYSKATTIDLSSFNTSKVTSMDDMFSYSQATTLDLSSFDTSNVTNMSGMFAGSRAATGYARTAADASRLNNSTNKPGGLNFIVKP